jgi:hypothetical protein
MSEIKLSRRIKYAGDVHKALIECGWNLEVATSFVNRIPDADAVEVVRCKDCKHKPTCKHTRRLGINGYCSEGERKD